MSKTGHKIMVLLLNLGINVLLLLVVDALFENVRFQSARDFIAAAVLLMFANAFLKPALIVLTLPWRDICPFWLEWPYLTVPDMIKDKMIRHILDV